MRAFEPDPESKSESGLRSGLGLGLGLGLIASCGLSCHAADAAPPTVMPWLFGFTRAAATDSAAPGSSALSLTAPLVDTGTATVVASYRDGVAAFDAAGRELGHRGFDPVGTADDVVGLAVGDAGLDVPIIAVAVETGGKLESSTSLVLYAPTVSEQLAELFDEPVVERHGDTVTTGAVLLLPHALVYRAPRGAWLLWIFDVATGRYVGSGASRWRRSTTTTSPACDGVRRPLIALNAGQGRSKRSCTRSP